MLFKIVTKGLRVFYEMYLKMLEKKGLGFFMIWDYFVQNMFLLNFLLYYCIVWEVSVYMWWLNLLLFFPQFLSATLEFLFFFRSSFLHSNAGFVCRFTIFSGASRSRADWGLLLKSLTINSQGRWWGLRRRAWHCCLPRPREKAGEQEKTLTGPQNPNTISAKNEYFVIALK